MVSPLIYFRHAARKAAQIASTVQPKAAGQIVQNKSVGKVGRVETTKPTFAPKAPVGTLPVFGRQSVRIAKPASRTLQRSSVAEEEAKLIQLGGAAD